MTNFVSVNNNLAVDANGNINCVDCENCKSCGADRTVDMFGLTLRTFGTKKGVKDLKPIRLMVTDDASWKLKCASFSAHCSVGELCNAIVMQWLSEHEAEIKKD